MSGCRSHEDAAEEKKDTTVMLQSFSIVSSAYPGLLLVAHDDEFGWSVLHVVHLGRRTVGRPLYVFVKPAPTKK